MGGGRTDAAWTPRPPGSPKRLPAQGLQAADDRAAVAPTLPPRSVPAGHGRALRLPPPPPPPDAASSDPTLNTSETVMTTTVDGGGTQTENIDSGE